MQHDAANLSQATKLREAIMADLATIHDYGVAVGKSERAIYNYIDQGLPVTYIGNTPFVVLSKASKYWADRARERTAPKVGRPRKHAA